MTPLETKRHSAAHILAAAVEQLFPGAKFGTGPTVENGFYYDVKTDTPITEADLKKLEKLVRKLIARGIDFEREELTVVEARDLFAKKNQLYKLEIIERLAKQGKKTVSVYRSGDFVDLCDGPHVKNTSEINPRALKITKLSGAYWNNDENNDQLTRVYGLLFDTEEELKEYLTQQEEAKKRDHRKLGKELELFAFSDKVGAGLPLFTPRGTAVRAAIIERIAALQKKYGWQYVTTPHLTKPELYETSGHLEKFAEDLFYVRGKNKARFVLKPMNCPHHTQIFAAFPKSYKDLPVRYAENGVVYRDEQAGELLGLSRVRHITQDDGHAFVAREQMAAEIENIIEIIKRFYTDLGMLREGNYWVSLSLHDPETPEKYLIEENGLFLEAEKILEQIAQRQNLPYRKMIGEAAFYGPKLDFQFKDALGREWQLGTVQLDFNMPERFGLRYTDRDGNKQTPVMIHRAVAGSLERFMALLIEHTAGKFPFWLSPEQVRVLPVAETHLSYARNIEQGLLKRNFRVTLDDSTESFGKKVRKVKQDKVPYFVIVGDKDIAENKLTLEYRDEQISEKLTLPQLLEKLSAENELS